jgi:4-amino-4-deoxy-L-arabinose transferase-like glycosyltransferase
VRGLPTAIRGWRDRAVRQAQAPDLSLALWVAVPLLIFCLARSRLPLYLLPLFVPLALVIARQVAAGTAQRPRLRWVLAWAALVLALRVGSAYVPSDKDAAARYGLHLYLGAEVESLALAEAGAFSYDPEFDESLAVELAELPLERGVVFVTKSRTWPEVERRIRARGFTPVVRGEPLHNRIIFTVDTGRRKD